MRAKKLSILLSVVIGLAIPTGQSLDDEPFYKSYSGFELPTDVAMPEKERHPSLWFSSSQIEAMRAKKDQDSVAAGFWKKLSSSEFLLMDYPPVPKLEDDKKIVHKYYGTLTQAAMYNAFMYLMGGDKKQAYLDKAIEALERGYAGPLYQLDPIVKGSAVDEIYQGVWAQNFAAAYDWVEPALSKDQDERIRENLREHAAYMNLNLFSWAASPHNHVSKPAWGLATMALALSEEPAAEEWLTTAIEGANANTRYFFARDGLYREGSHYYMFSMLNFLPFLHHYKNTTDYDPFPVFQPAFEWPILIRNGKGWMPNQEDSFIRPFPSSLMASAYKDASTRLHSSAPLASVLQWNSQNTDLSPFDASEARSGYNYTGATWDYAKPLIEYLTYDPDIEPVAPDGGPVEFLESGQTAFRNDWSFADPKHRYLLFQGVADADNHEHFDHLSFILQAENQMMHSDGGYTRQSYGEPMRTDWYLTPEAHNVVTVDGKAPEDLDHGIGPESRYRLASHRFASEMKTAAYKEGGTHSRLIAMVEGDRFAVLDVVELPRPKKVEILMHGGRAALGGDKTLGVWEYSDDDYGPASFLDQWFCGKGFSYEVREGELTYIKGDYKAFPYTVQSKTTQNVLAMHLLEPRGAGVGGRSYEFLRKSEETIVVQAGDEWHLCNVADTLIGEGSWETDALYAFVKFEGAAFKRAGLVEARRFDSGEGLELVLNTDVALSVEALEAGGYRIDYSVGGEAHGVIRMGERERRLDFKGEGSMIVK